MMSRGVRHLMTVVLLSVLLLLFYLSLSTEPLSPLLRASPHSPSILNAQHVRQETDGKSNRYVSSTSKAKDSIKRAADDAATIKELRESYLFPPSTEPYNLEEPSNINPSMGQAQAIDYIFKAKRDGFYLECGGLDGEVRSNTLFFERYRGWRGLVIEADPANFAIMKTKHRRAYTSPTCLATTPYPSKVVFAQNSNRGHIYNVLTYDDAPAIGLVNVQCFPLYSYLLALNTTTVDYFSLDVEGAEYKVLETIPWDKLDIKTLSVEYFHDAEGKVAIKQLLESKGYDVYMEVTDPNNLANDFIFVKRELMR
uniref:Protein Star n=1 Tax=Hirondellea gigas TaxID=1518452 RepID=A0A6A7FVM6_9CRUS